MTQGALFDVKKTQQRCTACRALNPKDCRWAHDIRHDAIPWGAPRPKGCLASAQNRDGVPY